jgi:hypothetical protein
VEEAIAITAIVVSGVVGLGAPAIAGRFQHIHERERLQEQRRARELAELGAHLDDVAGSLDRAARGASILVRTFLERGVGYNGLGQLLDDAYGDLHDARRAIAHLFLRMPIDADASQAARECVAAIERAVHDIAAARLFGQDPPEEIRDRITADGESWSAEWLRFVDEGRALIGAREVPGAIDW